MIILDNSFSSTQTKQRTRTKKENEKWVGRYLLVEPTFINVCFARQIPEKKLKKKTSLSFNKKIELKFI